MALAKFNAPTCGIRGGVVFSNLNGVGRASAMRHSGDARTAFQVAARNRFLQAREAYANSVTPAQRADWDNVALLFTTRGRCGGPRPYKGHEFYTRCACFNAVEPRDQPGDILAADESPGGLQFGEFTRISERRVQILMPVNSMPGECVAYLRQSPPIGASRQVDEFGFRIAHVFRVGPLPGSAPIIVEFDTPFPMYTNTRTNWTGAFIDERNRSAYIPQVVAGPWPP